MPVTASLEDLDDRDLVELAQNSCRPAFRQLIQRHREPVLRHLGRRFGIPRARAEDLFQDAALRSWQHIFRFDPRRSSWSNWLYTITENGAKNANRDDERARDALTFTDLTTDDDPDIHPLGEGALFADRHLDPGRLAERRDLRELLREVVNDIPEPHGPALQMRLFEDMTYEEIADRLGVALGTVKSRISRARNLAQEEIRSRAPGVPEEILRDV